MTDFLRPVRLVVFTRYPDPGKTKTRLIPGLGAEGAADLQRQMTEYGLATAQAWQQGGEVSQRQIVVLTAGGTPKKFRAWLGDRYPLYPQADGDLGDRMGQALAEGFEAGCGRIVIIGIDCPDITAELLSRAFEALERHDLVLGPATDGGYYLIGLRASAQAQAVPELFRSMPWGQETVLAITLERAASQNLSLALLEELTDVDYPEDLWVWEKHRR